MACKRRPEAVKDRKVVQCGVSCGMLVLLGKTMARWATAVAMRKSATIRTHSAPRPICLETPWLLEGRGKQERAEGHEARVLTPP